MDTGIYIHIPFCVKKCSYCDFYSITDLSLIDDYLDALCKEMTLLKDISQTVSSIYIGGGTPSLLSIRQMDKLMQFVNSSFNITQNLELTIEINPGSVDTVKARQYKTLGINRISVGAQSFNNDDLRILDRIHNVKDIFNSVITFENAGFTNISLDLIYGIAEQTLDRFAKNIENAVSLNVGHISTYALSVEPGTALYNAILTKKITPQSDDVIADMFDFSLEQLCLNGYSHYEISNFCRENMQCRHNLKYWKMANYIGIGASAHSFYNNYRIVNVKDVVSYIKQLRQSILPIESKFKLDDKTYAADAIMLGLRLNEGIKYEHYKRYLNKTSLEELLAGGFIEIKNGRLMLTKKSYFISNKILSMLI